MNDQNNRPRIVITGIGWVTPLGHAIEPVWKQMLAGTSAIRKTGQFDASTFPTTFSAEVTDYDHNAFVRYPDLHRGARPNSAFALGAARQAWEMAGMDAEGACDPDRVGVYLGAGEGSPDLFQHIEADFAGWDAERRGIDAVKWAQRAKTALSAASEIEQETNMPLYHVANELGAAGPAYNCLTACAASTQAVGEAVEILRRGDADAMVSGGTHTMIHPMGVTGFNRLTALSTQNEAIESASRPFTHNRGGFVLGEGAGIVILETLEHATKRGATPLAEITGYGSSADAYRITDMHPESLGPIAAMRLALEDAGVSTSDIDYISAHGTGTEENDKTETRAIREVFGDRAKQTPVSSIKSMIGHLIAAAGAVELIACVLAIRDNVLPPTINYSEPDPALDLDYVPNTARQAEVNVCLSNSFGFGGQNDTLIIRRFEA